VHVKPSGFPVEAKVTIDKKGQFEKKKAFYIRLNNGTIEVAHDEKQKYMATRWPPPLHNGSTQVSVPHHGHDPR
jgi:hypothetical protein